MLVVFLTLLARENITGWPKEIVSEHFLGHTQSLPVQGDTEVIFSPKGGATTAIIKAIGEARASIFVAAYSFTSYDIAKALLEAKQRNVQVKIILDKSQISHKYSSSTFFSNQGFELRIDVKHAIYHNKFIIIDEKTIITGSFNFTKAAEFKNAENLLIMRNNPGLAKRYIDAWWHDWQQALSKEDFLERKNSFSKTGNEE